jgi:hypothetical protein
MYADNVLPWRPRMATLSPPEVVWMMRKQQWQIDCTLQDCGKQGWSVCFLLNGQWFFRSRFRSWVGAIEAAEDKYEELSESGWTACAR